MVESSCQFTPGSLGGVLYIVLYSPLPEVSRSRDFLSYLIQYGDWHLQNELRQFNIIKCGSDYGDVLTGEAVV